MTSIRLLPSLACAALLLVPALGCRPDRGPGSLTVSYTLGNDKACSDVGIFTVQAQLVRGTGDERTALYDMLVACGEDIVFEDVEPKTYEVEILAFDANDVAVFDNLAKEEQDNRRIEIFEAADSTYDVDLIERPATLAVRWRLGAGGFGNCAGVGIDAFEIKAFNVGGGGLMLETTLDCELDGEGAGNYRPIPDPDRELVGVNFAEVGVQALDSSGNDVGTPATFMFTPVGPGYPVEIGVECDETGCQPEA
ncbi:MAG: hypothetical protein KC431_16585 [Myxococcales bacterium]|nr:hypothetical protein [Myxococcales bacterium]